MSVLTNNFNLLTGKFNQKKSLLKETFQLISYFAAFNIRPRSKDNLRP